MDFTESCIIVGDMLKQAFPIALAFALGQKVVRIFINMVFGKVDM